MVQIGQFIDPSVYVFFLFQLFQYFDLLFQADFLRRVHLVQQNIFSAVLRRHLAELFIILPGIHHIAQFQAELRQRVDDHPASWPFLVGHLQNGFAVLVTANHLIDIADRAEHLHALHPPPVDRIRYLRCFPVVFFFY